MRSVHNEKCSQWKVFKMKSVQNEKCSKWKVFKIKWSKLKEAKMKSGDKWSKLSVQNEMEYAGAFQEPFGSYWCGQNEKWWQVVKMKSGKK